MLPSIHIHIQSFVLPLYFLDPVMLFPMDLTEDDVLLGSLNGTLMHGATVIPGVVGYAVYIYGSQAYVDFGTHTSGCFFVPSQCYSGMTVSFWLKIFATIMSPVEIFLDNGGITYTSVGICIWRSSAGIGITIRNELGGYNSMMRHPSPMECHFVIFTVKAGTINIFMNGCYTSPTQTDFWTRGTALTTSMPFTIGSSNQTAPFALDNIRIWYTELSRDEIWDLYSNTADNI